MKIGVKIGGHWSQSALLPLKKEGTRPAYGHAL
jgi:hypothetical protein